MLVWAVWCYPDTCLELLKVIWSWAVFPDVSQAATGTELEGASALTTILTQCEYASQCDAASSFGVMVSRIQLAMKCKRYAQMSLKN